MIPRNKLKSRIANSIQINPVTLLLGPRQCGKTTIAQVICKELNGVYFDLEDPEVPINDSTAKLVLKDIHGLIVIDECQRQPSLFPLLRVLADRKPLKSNFLLLGSVSPHLVKGVSESLAGRVEYIHMQGFNCDEIPINQFEKLWLRGNFPVSYLANNDESSFRWRLNFIKSFLERDIPQLGIRVPSSTLRRFWTMVSHYHGNILNISDFSRSLGTKQNTARHYLDILTEAFMIRQIQPWFTNISKRLVKAPKIYLSDSGITHALLGLRNKLQVQSHPKLGYTWEGFVIDQILSLADAYHDAYFYKTHAGAELDLLIFRNGKAYGFEIKYEDSPHTSKSMHIVIQDLQLEKLWVVTPGENMYPLTERISVVPFKNLQEVLAQENLI